ncbi:translation initiation factor IF-2-like [Schistocerca serialis cubense]|uniref:translation initiation factor IF-2-like n=1 Tax=Schistocerca serialis cubense TaxID=2023355 RepID=UPI00214E6967|nr:translation initiation factor IF-2-like [Schistocerca serialis cubense]
MTNPVAAPRRTVWPPASAIAPSTPARRGGACGLCPPPPPPAPARGGAALAPGPAGSDKPEIESGGVRSGDPQQITAKARSGEGAPPPPPAARAGRPRSALGGGGGGGAHVRPLAEPRRRPRGATCPPGGRDLAPPRRAAASPGVRRTPGAAPTPHHHRLPCSAARAWVPLTFALALAAHESPRQKRERELRSRRKNFTAKNKVYDASS